MTDKIKWGDPIACDGKRPEWLREDRLLYAEIYSPTIWSGAANRIGILTSDWSAGTWRDKGSIRLPADHPYYCATAKGFTYWPGGESAPEDWDGSRDGVLYRDGEVQGRFPVRWTSEGRPSDVIGYRKRVEPAGSIPQWAIDRVYSLVGAEYRGGEQPTVTLAFAHYIAQHEQPPVDPDLLLAREVATAKSDCRMPYDNGESSHSPMVRAALAAIKLFRERNGL